METFSNAIKCRQCRCVSESPVILPCCHSVCKKHEQERTRVVCSECECEYEVPKGGFQENIALTQIIASGISEVELRHEHKDAIKASNQVKEKFDEVKKLVMDPIYYIHERIGELKLRIDLAREEFKLKIDDEAESILRNLEEYENECKQSSSSNDIDSKVKEIEDKLEKTKLDLDTWTKYLDKFKINCKECEIIQRKCEETVDKLQEQLELFKESLLMSNFEKTEKIVDGFEKLGISFDYKSQFKGVISEKLTSEKACYLTLLQDGTLAIGNENGSISIWNEETQTLIRTLEGHTKKITDVLELSDFSLASASEDKTIKIWNAQSGQMLRSLESHTDEVYELEQLKDGFLASGSKDKTIKIWKPNTSELLKTIDIGEDFYSLVFLGNENLACAAESKFVILNTETKRIVRSIENDTYNKFSLLSDQSLAIGDIDSNITIWDVNNWKLLRTLKGHSGGITALKLLADGSLASGTYNGEIKIWNPLNGQLVKTIKINEDAKAVHSICQLRNGTLVFNLENLIFFLN